VSYVSAPALIRFLKRGFRDGSADDRLDALQAVETLILDDLGAEQTSAYNETTLFELIHARYRQTRPTIITSNVALDALEMRIASRIAGLAVDMQLFVDDIRPYLRRGWRPSVRGESCA
jgi:DNA replication protein DnaC